MNIDFILEKMLVNKNETAIVTNGCEYTFGDILQKYEGSKNILNSNSIKNGSIVSVIAEFSPLSIALFLALIENDSIIVPISSARRRT